MQQWRFNYPRECRETLPIGSLRTGGALSKTKREDLSNKKERRNRTNSELWKREKTASEENKETSPRLLQLKPETSLTDRKQPRRYDLPVEGRPLSVAPGMQWDSQDRQPTAGRSIVKGKRNRRKEENRKNRTRNIRRKQSTQNQNQWENPEEHSTLEQRENFENYHKNKTSSRWCRCTQKQRKE